MVNQMMNEEDFKRLLYEALAPIKETLQLHTTILNQHTHILEHHSQILERHTQILEQHTRMLKQLKVYNISSL